MEIELSSELKVDIVDHMGSDMRICQAARVSTLGRKVQSRLEDDAGLINYLMKNGHGTPFEHNALQFFVEVPIFVFREWHRHRIGQSYNEESGRYKVLAPKFYTPPKHRPLTQSGKPGHYEFNPGTPEQHEQVQVGDAKIAMAAYKEYQRRLEMGIAREVARMVLPVNIFSSMYVTLNARSLMAFLQLRTSNPEATFPSKPMWEIDYCAQRLEHEFSRLFPITYDAWNKNGRVAP